MLKVQNVSTGYGENIILKDISFEINKGERFVVLGESGCGKSTLLKAIVGLNPPKSGEVFMNGEKIVYPLSEKSDFYRKIGILYQNSALLNSMTVLENVMLPIKMHFPDFSDSVAKDIAMEKLSLVNLALHAEKLPSELSGGMKKRTALARAMVLDPEIIFFDEPQAGLDPVTTKEMDMLFIKLNEGLGITFFIVTHEILSIKRLSQKVLMLGDGIVLFCGTLEDALNSKVPKVSRFFNIASR